MAFIGDYYGISNVEGALLSNHFPFYNDKSEHHIKGTLDKSNIIPLTFTKNVEIFYTI